MFNFMKKGTGEKDREKLDREEKERRKKEKKLRKEAKGVSGSMSTEELLRLDEVRKTLKIHGRKEKEKHRSGLTAADITAEFFVHLDADRSTLRDGGSSIELDRGNEEIVATPITITERPSTNGGPSRSVSSFISQSSVDSTESATHSTKSSIKSRFLPPVPPKPPKRGILKGSRSSIQEECQNPSPDSRVLLMRNTIQNEMGFESIERAGNPAYTSAESLRSDIGPSTAVGPSQYYSHSTAAYGLSPRLGTQSPLSNLHVMTSPSPSAESLTDTTNSSFATPPFSLSPIGESQGTDRWSRVHTFEDIDLPLPPITLVKLPPPREFVIKRQKSPRNDFGFSLRKAMCLDRSECLTAPVFKPVIFAEPGAGGGATGLLPGDRLLKVNGSSVSELTRETIIEMIRNSGDSVTVEVQPVSELVELSRRCMISPTETDEVDRKVVNVDCNTLKRSASKRFKQQQSLRSSISPATPHKPGSGLKPEIHRGCTGKAHACGTLKSKVVNTRTHDDHHHSSTVTNHHNHHHHHQQYASSTHGVHSPSPSSSSSTANHRKNSVSSETISDSGSENSSWNSNELSVQHQVSSQLRKQQNINNFIIGNGSGVIVNGCGSQEMKTKLSVLNSPVAVRRKKLVDTLVPPPSIDETDRRSSPLVRRTRLYSDGDKESTPGGGQQSPANDKSNFQRNRSFRVLGSNKSRGQSTGNALSLVSAGVGSKPPWQGVFSKNKVAVPSSSCSNSPRSGVGGGGNSPAIASRTNSFNRTTSLRSSLRRKESVDYNVLYEKSLVMRCVGSGGGLFKCFDGTIRKQSQFNDDSTLATGEQVWLVHRGGFCAAIRLPQQKEHIEHHKVVVQLLHNGEELTVDEDDIEKSNPSSLDLVEDICQLKHLNEASVLHCLRQRYASNLIHTKAGPILMVVNPMAPLSLYSEKVVSMFRGCKTEDMPPHVYSLAQTAYRTMLETRRDQSLIFMGRSGSGKTTSFKHALYYLALAAGSVNKLLTAEKVNAINTILEAFGNTKTSLNSNATRFTQILSLDFDQSGQIASASVQVLLPERQRAGRRTMNEHSFHIMTRLLAGAEGQLQKELCLENISSEDNHPFVSLSQKLEDRHRAASEFTRTALAFDTLNIDATAVKGIWAILAAIYHLGIAGVTKIGSGPTARIQFANPSAARKASTLLGVSFEDLQAAAFAINAQGGTSPAKSPTDSTDVAWESLEGLVVGLYSEAMSAVSALINKAVCTSTHTIASILLVDSPGFQNPASCGVQTGASLSDLRHNYLQERLQLLFHHMTLVAPRDRYAQELVEIDTEGLPESHPGPLVSLIDKAPQNHVVRTSQRDLREQDRRGLLWLLDEESMYPNSNDDSFLERVFSHYGDREHQHLIRKASGMKQFILQHLQGTNPVLYTAHGWLKNSREHPTIRNAASLLQDSSKDEINRLYVGSLTRGNGMVFCGSIVGLEGTQSLRRVSSIRRSFTSAGVKRNSVMLQMKFTVDGVVDTLRRTGTHFVHCYLLQHNAGLQSNSTGGSPICSHQGSEEMVNVPLLRSQIRGSQLLEAARLHRLGFPESVPLNEFVRRFGLLVDVSLGKDSSVEQILMVNEIDPSSYRIGPSQIFSFNNVLIMQESHRAATSFTGGVGMKRNIEEVLFRSGVLSQLEAKRDELLSDRIIQLQAYCRGYLARKRVSQRRVQEIAVRCIQRNVKAFLTVRDWPWWRLLIRVQPLLNVHRTEEQLKSASDELHILRAKLEKIENDRNALKTENEKLENKLSEMTVDLAEERSGSHMASERLEAETAERLKLEKELHEQQTKVKNLQETSEKLEMELICAKSELNGISEDDDPENEDSGGVYRLKYERVARELEFTKRRLQSQHEHDLEQLVGLKKQLEKKLSDAYEEVEEQRQVVGQWKRKAQKMTNEMNDLRMLLEEQNGRNNLLEKKQRKFDSECLALQDAARLERQSKDRLSREKDVLIAEKFTLEQSLADTRLELDLKEEKLASLQRELEEMTFGGGTEEEIAQLRRSKMDMDRRIKEQEEELDEMAGQVQLLEQAKLRLEMTLETMRKDARREAQLRDDELEEARGSAYKKIKALECQLETEHEERTLLLREKHELERRLASMEDQDRIDRQAEEAITQKLKRDLRKYKALLKDAHAQLERLKADSPGKTLIRQLRNQLEDAESTRSLAVKARQTAEAELAEVQSMFEESQRARNDAEDRATTSQRDRAELQAQIEENEEEMSELMKKYSATVKQLNTEQIAMSEYEFRISECEAERNNLKDQVSELQQRLENVENMSDPSAAMLSKRLEIRTKELESRLELEQATRSRLEVQITRHKESVEKIQNEVTQSKMRELNAQDGLKKAQKSLRELREEFHVISNREQESITRRKDLEKKLENAESEAVSLRNDLRLALQRIADLQQAMEEGDDDVSESEDSDSTDASLSDLEERLKPIQVKRTSISTKKETTNGVGGGSDTTLVIREKKSENSPRITVTSPSMTSIGGNANSISNSLKNGESSYA